VTIETPNEWTEELDSWATDFEAFQARFSHLFARREPRQQAAKYMRGLMSDVRRKNGWQLAEAMGDERPDATQRLLYHAKWDADRVCDELQQYVIENLGDDEGIGVVDETGFLKKGTKSVGVKRQYTGTAGKVENSQVGVFVSYAVPGGPVFLDRRLFLPREWCADAERRAEAKVPAEIRFQSKPQLALDMLEHAWAQGVPMRWVTGDEVYGNAPYLRESIATHNRLYVLAVSCNAPVWRDRPAVELPTRDTGGRPRTRARLAEDAAPSTTVAAIVGAWPEEQWKRLTVAEGEKGPRTYDWGRMRVVESRDGLPGPDAWLLARRSISDPTEIAYYLSNAPLDTSLLTLAQVAATRYTVEQCIEESKGETGLDEYEVRHWHSWYRHITLSMMAHTWLAVTRSKAGEKTGVRPGIGRADRSGSPTLVGRGDARAASVADPPSDLVALASDQALAGQTKSLSSAGLRSARTKSLP
jgi:SRSO17 transposase